MQNARSIHLADLVSSVDCSKHIFLKVHCGRKQIHSENEAFHDGAQEESAFHSILYLITN